MPLFAAWIVWMPLETVVQQARSAMWTGLLRDEAVKNEVALSRAELTFLPVDRMFWDLAAAWEEMDCKRLEVRS